MANAIPGRGLVDPGADSITGDPAGFPRGNGSPWLGAIACALLVSWAAPGAAQAPEPGPQDPTRGDAARLYAGACAACHGRLGDGEGPGASGLYDDKPRDFTAGVFKFRSTPTGSLPTDEDLFRTISRGVPGTWMPAWGGRLSVGERWALIRYIKGFSEFFAEEEPDPNIDIPPEPGSTPERVREGRLVFALLRCWQCHGPRGKGDGPSAGELTDDWGHKIVPYNFTGGRYKNGSEPADLYRTLVTGLNGTPMPAYEGDVVAFPGGGGGGSPVDLSTMGGVLGEAWVQDVRDYLAGQPTQAQLEAMSEAEVDALVQQRLWALVYYLQSLDRRVRDAGSHQGGRP